MKFFNSAMLAFSLATLFALPLNSSTDTDSAALIYRCDRGDNSQYEQDLDEKDSDELYDYENTKRTINVSEKACNLTISGDVRAEWRRRCEETYLGTITHFSDKPDKPYRFGKNKYKCAFNLKFDYVCDRAWAVAHLQFDNSAGVCNDHSYLKDPEGMHGSGSGCDVDLKKAYMGYNLCCNGCTRLDVEVGRRRLYQVFDSEVQFLSRFDGILIKYDTYYDCIGDMYLHAAGFVVDFKSDHYAWLIEAGLCNILSTGFDFKYSLVDWRKHGKNAMEIKDAIGNRYFNSQFTFAYHFDPENINVPSKLFGAVLWNHDATIPDGDFYKGEPRAGFAWYTGFRVGDVVCAGDWAFSLQYQWVEARSIPDDDVSGIGNGNIRNCSFTADNQGNTNFKGWRIEALYAFTDNLSFDLRAEWSTDIDGHHFGGPHKFNQVRLESIYSF